MEDKERLVQTVMQAADGEIVGSIRTQKIFYLLEQLGAGCDFRYSYHHYGPFSRVLSNTLDWMVIDKILNAEEFQGEPGSYYIYKLLQPMNDKPDYLGSLCWQTLKKNVSLMKAQSSIVLELAATIHWLKTVEKYDDWRHEIKIRKSQKSTTERLDKAERLLKNLGIVY